MAIPIISHAGKAAWWAGKQATRPITAAGRSAMSGGSMAGVVLGGAALAGVGSAIMDREGPYADIQETTFGDRDAIRYSMQAGLRTAFDNSDEYDIPGPMDYYYGRPANVPGMHNRNRSSGSTTPVSGNVVFGMHHLRR